MSSNKIFPVWKTVMVGTIRDFDDAITKIRPGACLFREFQDDVVWFSRTRKVVDLVLISGDNPKLCCGEEDCLADFFARAHECGLSLCLPEMAIQIVAQYPDLLTSGDDDTPICVASIPFVSMDDDYRYSRFVLSVFSLRYSTCLNNLNEKVEGATYFTDNEEACIHPRRFEWVFTQRA